METALQRTPASSYRVLFGVPGFPRLAAGLLLGRSGDAMWALVLVLFVLVRFHSPALAGLSLLAGQVPGKVVSPLAGALLDRYGRTALVVLDYTMAALLIGGIAGLDAAGALTPAALIICLLVTSVTQPLSATGLRSLFPVLVPRRLWDRANAVDSGTFVIATVAGPAVGGALVGLFGARVGVIAVALTFATAAGFTLGVRPPRTATPPRAGVLASSWLGLRYVVTNPTLRGLAIVISLLNVGGGIMLVAVPVLVQRSLGGSPSLTGLLFACFGLSGLASSVVFGRAGSDGRERWFLAGGNAFIGLGLLVFAFSNSLPLAIIAALIAGAGNGPCDIGLFSLRLRRTEPEMLGRALAVSMSLNSVGLPIGSSLGGWLLATGSTATAFIVAGLVTLVGVVLIPSLIPRQGRLPAPIKPLARGR